MSKQLFCNVIHQPVYEDMLPVYENMIPLTREVLPNFLGGMLEFCREMPKFQNNLDFLRKCSYNFWLTLDYDIYIHLFALSVAPFIKTYLK